MPTPSHPHERHHLCRQAGLGRCNSVRYFDAIFQTPAVGIAMVDLEGRIIDGNAAFEKLLGYSSAELPTLTFQDVTHPEDLEASSESYRALLEEHTDASHLEKRYVRKDGSVFWGQLSLSSVQSDAAAPLFFLAIVVDITQRKEAEWHILRQNTYLKILQSVTAEANEASTLEAALLKCITLICSQIGWPVGHIYFPSVDHPLLLSSGSLWYLENPARFRQFQDYSEHTLFSSGIGMIGQVFQSGRPCWIPDVSRDAAFLRSDTAGRAGLKAGFAFPLMMGSEVGAVMEFFTTEERAVDSELLEVMGQIGTQLGRILERKRAAEALEAMAFTDGVTRLPNRLLFSDRLNQAIGHARRHDGQVGVLYLNLDRFTFINESMGHDQGDQLLRRVAERLTASVRESDTVARLGGDEFTILVPDIHELPEVTAVAEEILASLNRPFLLDGHELVVTPSIGICSYPSDGNDAPTLIRNAAAAMHLAKTQRNEFQHYSPRMNVANSEKLVLEQQLRKAIEREELLVHYQPRVCLRTGQVTGAEALIRWNHPELGLVSPAKFIPLAEETGLIIPITEWILRTVCEQG
ncbi:MAG TPA: diguanylate cyclase, partial [Stenomitos sp.]